MKKSSQWTDAPSAFTDDRFGSIFKKLIVVSLATE